MKLQTRSEITPVEMDDGTESYTESDKLWAMGFGALNTFSNPNNAEFSEVLKHAELSYVTNEVCIDIYAVFKEQFGFDIVTDNMMCAADLDQGTGRGCLGGKPKFDMCYYACCLSQAPINHYSYFHSTSSLCCFLHRLRWSTLR